jgi:TRAP-type uncharacterized transport system fused permease subunit
MFKAGTQAVRIGIAAYILPVMFVYSPSLLYQGDIAKSLPAAVTAVIGIISLASAVQGYFITQSRWYERVMMGAVALALIKPGYTTDLVGAVLLVAVVLLQTIRARVNPIKAILGKTSTITSA